MKPEPQDPKDHLAVPVSEAPADDIVQRLRREARPVPEGPYRALELDAADTILALRAEIARLRRLVADDAYAVSFQTFAQYRTSLLNAIDAAKDKP